MFVNGTKLPTQLSSSDSSPLADALVPGSVAKSVFCRGPLLKPKPGGNSKRMGNIKDKTSIAVGVFFVVFISLIDLH